MNVNKLGRSYHSGKALDIDLRGSLSTVVYVMSRGVTESSTRLLHLLQQRIAMSPTFATTANCILHISLVRYCHERAFVIPILNTQI